ncbi:17-beta-hydroxysteroid dehydrogenase 13 [Folsomia candida]|uniref:Short-chain dehydrogenase/reductase 3 n=1 Tax=Folsomia candida TaxID=158441 RepID=A0A226EQD4_FOLCA|nr:17-beta-hydroxysteroid dehydrogenase 13 [Folsomia candida]OXA59264.1 hypothetical protein Fcan01_06007 [Folsomia candida]
MEAQNLLGKVPSQNTFFSGLLEVIFLITYTVYTYIHLVYRWIRPRRLKSLDGEVFLITGSASGIGREVVYNLATNHPRTILVLWDSNESANQHIVDAVKLLGVEVFSYTVDVTNREEVEECARRVFDEVGFVSRLFNNAGVVGLGDLLSQTPEKIEKTMDVNVLSHFWILRSFLPQMIENLDGHIITTCSLAGHIGLPYDVPYAASKFAVRGYIESVKAEMRLHPLKPKIRFTTIYPSFVNTPLISRVVYKFKMQFLFNPLEPRYVAEKIVEGVRRNEEEVFVPRIGEFLVFLKGIMPKRAFQKLSDSMIESLYFKEEKVQ